MLPFFYVFYRFGKSIKKSFKDPRFEALLTSVVIVLAVGTVFYHYNEGWGWIDSMYFSVTTLTTVGYGDLSPHFAVSKIFTIIYLFLGIGILLSFLTYVAEKSIEDQRSSSILPWSNLRKNKESSAL